MKQIVFCNSHNQFVSSRETEKDSESERERETGKEKEKISLFGIKKNAIFGLYVTSIITTTATKKYDERCTATDIPKQIDSDI